jgi:hypothetical protein
MFLATVGQDSDTDMFAFFLADRLGKTLAELDDMPASEYIAWSSYHKVKAQQEDLARKAASHG